MASPEDQDAVDLIASRMSSYRQPASRILFLKAVLIHAAAGLAIMVGKEGAAEALYQLADEAVADGD
jgi:hypothetical protein